MENSEVMILNIQVCQGGAGGGAVGGGAAHRLTHKIVENVLLWSFITQKVYMLKKSIYTQIKINSGPFK